MRTLFLVVSALLASSCSDDSIRGEEAPSSGGNFSGGSSGHQQPSKGGSSGHEQLTGGALALGGTAGVGTDASSALPCSVVQPFYCEDGLVYRQSWGENASCTKFVYWTCSFGCAETRVLSPEFEPLCAKDKSGLGGAALE